MSAQIDFDETGHLSEPALALASDGRLDALPAEARAHLDACETCAMALADHALASVVVQEGFAAMAADVASAPAKAVGAPAVTTPIAAGLARPRVPRGLVAAAALVLVALSVPALPGLLRQLASAPEYGRTLVVALASMLRAATILVSRQDVALVCAAVFVVVGVFVATLASRREEKGHVVA